MSETFRVQHTEFFESGPEVDYVVEDWDCGCRTWPIVTHTITYSTKNPEALPKKKAWFVKKCRICREYPRPVEDC